MTNEPPTLTPLILAERHAENLAELNNRLGQRRIWHILPRGETDPAKAIALFDAQTGRQIPPAADLRAFLETHPFVYVQPQLGKKTFGTLQSSTRLLWSNEDSNHGYSITDGKQVVVQFRCAGLENWRLPTKEMLHRFATQSSNPYRGGPKYRLVQADGKPQAYWLTAGDCIDVDEGYWSPLLDGAIGAIFACNLHWQEASDIVLLTDLVNRDWRLVTPLGEEFPPKHSIPTKDLSIEALLVTWIGKQQILRSVSQDAVELNPLDYWTHMQLTAVDYTPCRLPRLEASQLTDPEKGLWELWGETQEALKEFNCVARDPGRDVQRRAVGIDFGTSSTVVAMDTANGARELLRIGVRDFYEPVHARHFENPTVLECLDFTAFNNAWTDKAYRPALDWDWMRAAHEAQASFRDNPGDTVVLSSILPRLKQWALRSNDNRRVRLTDRQGHEMELAPHTERNPVRGQPLAVSEDDPFDPIELYAWYLGMAINWRGRGLFLKYYLSFPVKYPREVKERVLASFRRG